LFGVRKIAVRVWLETAAPPVFGKEIDEQERPILQTRVSAFYFGIERL